jgi:predicted HTH domain antitoxin
MILEEYLRMSLLNIEIPDHLIIALNKNEETIINDLLFEYAQGLVQKGKLSTAQGAEFSSMRLNDFMNKMSINGSPVIDYDPDDLENELQILK